MAMVYGPCDWQHAIPCWLSRVYSGRLGRATAEYARQAHSQEAISTWTAEEAASIPRHPRQFPKKLLPSDEKMLDQSFVDPQQSLQLLVAAGLEEAGAADECCSDYLRFSFLMMI